jgi:elongation factor Ts
MPVTTAAPDGDEFRRAQRVRYLHQHTGVPLESCDKALSDANGDVRMAFELLRQWGFTTKEWKDMSAFTAKDVMSLKDRTGAGMMECKKALTEANGDVEKSIELLREWGVAKGAAPKSTEMKEGLVAGRISADGKMGVLVRLGCQTDFVARNEIFQKLLADVLELAFTHDVKTPADIAALKYPDNSGRTVDAVIKELIGSSIKENMAVTGLARFHSTNGIVGKYVHFNGKVGALIQIDGSNHAAASATAVEIAMHLAAGIPQPAVAINREQVSKEIVDRERAAASEGLEGKPEQIKEKIINGKLDKYFQDIVLLEQPFVKEEKKRIRDLVAEAGKAAGATLTLANASRLKVGEA